MADQRKRLSKKASKILFEIICEDTFEGHNIKTLLPATRRISKGKEALWDYILNELIRRSDELYDLGTVTSAWYYNLRKIGACLDQIDATDEVSIERMRTLERYVCNNLSDRLRKRGRAKREDYGDVKLTPQQILTLSRQSTMDATGSFSAPVAPPKNLAVKNERGSSNDENEKEKERDNEGISIEIGQRYDALDNTGEMGNGFNDLFDAIDTPSMEANEMSLMNYGQDRMMDEPPLPSRYHTPDTIPISRTNSTLSVSGYDADNEKGIIKRRRKELRKRGDRGKEVKVEATEECIEENEKNEREANDELEVGQIDEGEKEDNDGMNENIGMIVNLKGMIENLRDHIVALRGAGAVNAVDVEELANSLEGAANYLINNKGAA